MSKIHELVVAVDNAYEELFNAIESQSDKKNRFLRVGHNLLKIGDDFADLFRSFPQKILIDRNYDVFSDVCLLMRIGKGYTDGAIRKLNEESSQAYAISYWNSNIVSKSSVELYVAFGLGYTLGYNETSNKILYWLEKVGIEKEYYSSLANFEKL